MTNAEEVLPVFQEFRPDLIVLDLNMPPYSGFWVMEQLQQAAPGPFPQILVFTADSTPASRSRALDAGATGYLTKPFSRDELLATAVLLLGQRGTARPAAFA